MPRLHPLALAAALLSSHASAIAQGTTTATAPRPASSARAAQANLPLTLQADSLRGRPDLDVVAEGHVQLQRGRITIRSDRLSYDSVEDRARAQGDVQILTAEGDRAFCCGMDLKEAIPAMTSGDSLGYDDPTKRQFTDVFKPIIAAINGLCVAGGLETVVHTDIRIAAEHARFGLGEVRWGLVPAGGSHVRLPQQMPWAVAMQLLLTGEQIDAKRAYEVGFLSLAHTEDHLEQFAGALAQALEEMS